MRNTLQTYLQARRDGYGRLEAVRFTWWLKITMPRTLRRYFATCPTGAALNRALDLARISNYRR